MWWIWPLWYHIRVGTSKQSAISRVALRSFILVWEALISWCGICRLNKNWYIIYLFWWERGRGGGREGKHKISKIFIKFDVRRWSKPFHFCRMWHSSWFVSGWEWDREPKALVCWRLDSFMNLIRTKNKKNLHTWCPTRLWIKDGPLS